MAMLGARVRRWLLLAAFVVSWPLAAAANGTHLGSHRDDVDVSRQPWSAIGKLYNETGGSCSGVVVARDKILTAAHCLFNFRTRQFIPAAALHFLVGYRTGSYAAHARVAFYEFGSGFDPLRYSETSDGDWAVLTLTERLPANIVPLKLRADIAPSGTPVVMAGYPRDRAFALTADSDCELREKVAGRRLMLHTCSGIPGYSGAPIMIRADNDEMQVAAIQIATFNADGTQKMLAVPAQAIVQASLATFDVVRPIVVADAGFGALTAPPAVAASPQPTVSEGSRIAEVLPRCKAPARLAHALLIAAAPEQDNRLRGNDSAAWLTLAAYSAF
jgi:protease YdgD